MPAPEPSSRAEEGELLANYTECAAKLQACNVALTHPTGSMLMTEHKKLEDALKAARIDLAPALAAHRDYRKGHPRGWS